MADEEKEEQQEQEEQEPEQSAEEEQEEEGDETVEGEASDEQEEGGEQEHSEDDHDGGDGDDHHDAGEEEDGLEESVVHVNRCCKVVRGGKRFSFSALVVAGDRNGKISWGFGKGNQVPTAIQKAVSDSRKRIIEVPIVHGTIPHTVELNYCATDLLLRPASPGTGVMACLPVRTVVNLAGITDLLTKIHGSTNPINTVKATYEGLKSLRTKERIEELRDVKIS